MGTARNPQEGACILFRETSRPFACQFSSPSPGVEEGPISQLREPLAQSHSSRGGDSSYHPSSGAMSPYKLTHQGLLASAPPGTHISCAPQPPNVASPGRGGSLSPPVTVIASGRPCACPLAARPGPSPTSYPTDVVARAPRPQWAHLALLLPWPPPSGSATTGSQGQPEELVPVLKG